jgi:RHS repeat-associated protein
MKEYRDYNYNGLDYFYDSNGNMTADLDRDIVAIRYNLLNQPDTVQFRNGSAIVNYYTADGKRTGSKYLTPQTTVVIPAGQTFGSTSGTAAMSSHVTARRGSLEYAGADFESDTLIRIHNGDGYLDCSEQDFRYFVRDYQGNIRTVNGSAVAKLTPVEPPFSLTIRGAIGGDKPPIRPKPIEYTVTYQRMQYYPFGLPYEAHYQPEEQPYKYGGKEFIELHGYDSYDFDARMYYPALCRFMTMDPLCEKYYSISPYAYCNNNPVKYIDSDGRDVKPAGTAELIMIQNTLPKEARDYVRLDNNGLIDKTLLNSYDGKSLNFNNLRTMANSDRIVEVVLDDKFTYMGQDGKLGTATMIYQAFDPDWPNKDLKGETTGGLSTGEGGFMGKVLFPDKDGMQNSPNGNIVVIVNKNLSPAGAAESYSHEANGHALLYILNGGDHKGASHQAGDGLCSGGDRNKTLVEMIINSKKETIKNMQE